MTSTTNPRRYQDDLRRIVGIDEGARGLAPADPKPRIPGARGIAYTTESGGSATASGNAPSDGSAGTKVPTGASDGSNESGKDGLSSNGQYQSGIDGVNPGDFSRPVEESELSVDRLFDGSIGLGGSLPLLKAFDCDSGKELELIFDGGFIPPEGWDDPDEGPLPDDYTPGFYRAWVLRGGGLPNLTVSVLSDSEIPAIMAARYGAGTGNAQGFYYSSTGRLHYLHQGNFICADGTCGLGQIRIVNSSITCPASGGQTTTSACWSSGNAFAEFSAVRSCVSIPDPVCALPPPRPEFWPEDNIIQLARQEDGSWITSERDPDVTPEYTQPLSSIQFCDSQGNEYRTIPGRDGDLIIENQETGDFYVRNSEGTVYAFGSASAIKNYTAPAVLPEIAP